MVSRQFPTEIEQSRRPWHAGGRWNICSQYKDFHRERFVLNRAVLVPSPTNTIVGSSKAFAPLDPGQIDDDLILVHPLQSRYELRGIVPNDHYLSLVDEIFNSVNKER